MKITIENEGKLLVVSNFEKFGGIEITVDIGKDTLRINDMSYNICIVKNISELCNEEMIDMGKMVEKCRSENRPSSKESTWRL